VPVHTAVRGRARFRLAALGNGNGLARRAASSLAGLDGIVNVSASAATGTILVNYSEAETIESLQARICARLSKALEKPVRHARASDRDRPVPGARRTGIAESIDRVFRRRRPATVSGGVEQASHPFHSMTLAEVLDRYPSDAKRGLSIRAAEDRLRQYGPNLLPRLEPASDLEIWLRQFTTLPVGMLGASGAVALATGGIADAVAIAAVVLANGVIGFETEKQSEKTIAALSHDTPTSARVRRGGKPRTVSVADLVPGDVLSLLPGTRVPADGRVVESQRLTVDESALTGESMPVAKRSGVIADADTPLADRYNMVFCGTTVTGGSGEAIVVATGRDSEFGRIQASTGRIEAPETPMQRQLDRLGGQLALLSAAACAGVFVVGILRRHGVLEMLKSSISLGVAAVPEGLPTVATTTLALGIREMSRHNVAIRQLGAVEALGAVQVFCLDKTGTLTENRMDVVAVHAEDQRYDIARGTWRGGDASGDRPGPELCKRLLETVVLCNESETTEPDGRVTGSPTENALLELAMAAGIDPAGLRRKFPLLRTSYRSEKRHYMVTTHRAGKRRLIAVKGSPPEILPMCRWVLVNGRRRKLTDSIRRRLIKENERWAGEALRVLGVAQARVDAGRKWEDHGLTWLGLVGMTDPLREGMQQVIADLHRAGIRTVMITGDQSATPTPSANRWACRATNHYEFSTRPSSTACRRNCARHWPTRPTCSPGSVRAINSRSSRRCSGAATSWL
jgi:Ca2+-transporting ATPase